VSSTDPYIKIQNMKMRIVARAVVYDSKSERILLVKNRGQDFWYPPGGGWEYEKENIAECAVREVFEETGLKVQIKKLLYVQEFHDALDSISFEIFWLAEPITETTLDVAHVDADADGKVETVKWFSKGESGEVKVFPKRLQNSFWENAQNYQQDEDSFLGVIE